MALPAGSDRGIISGINVTPLVDIALVLLIIFIVTAKIVVAPAVPLDLPQASQSEDVQVVLSVLLPRDGSTLLNGAVVADGSKLVERARAAHRENPELRAVIQADGAVPHRRVIGVLDSLKEAGVTRVAFGALPVAESRPSRAEPE